jgi:hypothetical protein
MFVAPILLLASVLNACAPPVAPAPPTPPPTPTAVRATAVAALQSGPTATQVAVAAATSIAASPMRIVDASLDPADVANSSVTLMNTSGSPVDVGGWMLLVANYRVTLPKTDYMTVVPYKMLIVHLASSPTPTNGNNVYVGLGALDGTPRVNSDQIVLLSPQGDVASTYQLH